MANSRLTLSSECLYRTRNVRQRENQPRREASNVTNQIPRLRFVDIYLQYPFVFRAWWLFKRWGLTLILPDESSRKYWYGKNRTAAEKNMFICFQFVFICVHLTRFFSSWTCREGAKQEMFGDASPLIHNPGDAKAWMLNATPRPLYLGRCTPDRCTLTAVPPAAVPWPLYPRPLYPRQRGMVPIFVKDECVLRPVWADAEDLAHTGFRTSERQARNESHLTYTNTYFGLLSYDALMLARTPKCQLSSFIGRHDT
jgi:hypothetical protein